MCQLTLSLLFWERVDVPKKSAIFILNNPSYSFNSNIRLILKKPDLLPTNSGRKMLKPLLKKMISPAALLQARKASKNRKKPHRSALDPQLKLYDQILNTDFLHYGYFDDPETAASKISLDDIRQAQVRYAELILEQIKTTNGNVLDIGCGMGGLIRMLLEQNHTVMGVTPDVHQINYISQKYPAAAVLRAKFQNFPVNDHLTKFDTVIHSESLQYMGLNAAIDNVKKIMKPAGRWIVVDYFRLGKAHEKSGHQWDDFLEHLEKNNLKIVYEYDITPHIKPTLAFVYMWGEQIGKPIFEFLVEKLKVKHPGKHHLLMDLIATLEQKMEKNLKIVDPVTFSDDKKYILLSIEQQ